MLKKEVVEFMAFLRGSKVTIYWSLLKSLLKLSSLLLTSSSAYSVATAPSEPNHHQGQPQVGHYFLEYKNKELVLRSNWKQKQIVYEGKRIFFEQDCPTEIVTHRKAYSDFRKKLKDFRKN